MAGIEGHDEPCYYCGKPCNALAGNPSSWPVPLCHADDPGRVKWHHIGCVSRRCHLVDTALRGEINFAEWKSGLLEIDIAEGRMDPTKTVTVGRAPVCIFCHGTGLIGPGAGGGLNDAVICDCGAWAREKHK